MYEINGIRFYRQEIRDLGAAWIAMGLAFTFFLQPRFTRQLSRGIISPGELIGMFGLSMLTVGTGFLLHELAHKVVAVRFGQVAAFKADYAMLGLAVVSGLAGFLFAAPGAVYHRGRTTVRQRGLISVAGPVTNIGLAVIFLPLFFIGGFLGDVGRIGVIVNVFLAAFNMIPFGPLDGKSVYAWDKSVFALVLGTALLFGVFVLFAGVL